MTEEFHGKGYSTEPISGDEAAQHRHFFAIVSNDWGSVNKLVTLMNAMNIFYEVVRKAGPILMAVAGIGYWLKTQGWF